MPESVHGPSNNFGHLRVAIVHYWFVGWAGGERVVEQIAELFPEADLFALIAEPETMSAELRRHKLHTSFLQSLPFARRYHRHLLILQPLALEQFDFSDYDLVISSESGPAKGINTGPGTLHICYCHSPMRYLWDMYPVYSRSMRQPVRFLFQLLSHWLRVWDVSSSVRVDFFVANSRFVADRIHKYYRRDATVIHPPVRAVGVQVADGPGSYYLCAGRLVDYKRVDLAVEACRALNRSLKIVGDGPLQAELRSSAGPRTEFLGRISDDDLDNVVRGARALLFPGEEDFGLVPVEVMARGRPVIAYARGGALETVEGVEPGDTFRDGATGVFFTEQSAKALERAIEQFETMEERFSPQRLHEHACAFDTATFREKFLSFVGEALRDFDAARRSPSRPRGAAHG